jgi:phage gp36-like protein
MSYVSQSDLEGRVPSDVIVDALDDNRDGSADAGVWDKVAADVNIAVDGRLEGKFRVPLAGALPYVVREAAIVLACEALYLRRGHAGESNPWTKQADAFRARLERIGRGDEPLKFDEQPAADTAIIITEESKTHSSAGSLMV